MWTSIERQQLPCVKRLCSLAPPRASSVSCLAGGRRKVRWWQQGPWCSRTRGSLPASCGRGTPAKFLRNLTPQEAEVHPKSANNYAKLALDRRLSENGKTFGGRLCRGQGGAPRVGSESDEDQDSAMGIARESPPSLPPSHCVRAVPR